MVRECIYRKEIFFFRDIVIYLIIEIIGVDLIISINKNFDKGTMICKSVKIDLI